MNMENIKKELALRVNQLMINRKKTKQSALKAVSQIKSWPEKIAETDDLIYRIHNALNELLVQQNIHFNNDYEKAGFASFMEPTIHDLAIRNMED